MALSTGTLDYFSNASRYGTDDPLDISSGATPKKKTSITPPANRIVEAMRMTGSSGTTATSVPSLQGGAPTPSPFKMPGTVAQAAMGGQPATKATGSTAGQQQPAQQAAPPGTISYAAYSSTGAGPAAMSLNLVPQAQQRLANAGVPFTAEEADASLYTWTMGNGVITKTPKKNTSFYAPSGGSSRSIPLQTPQEGAMAARAAQETAGNAILSKLKGLKDIPEEMQQMISQVGPSQAPFVLATLADYYDKLMAANTSNQQTEAGRQIYEQGTSDYFANLGQVGQQASQNLTNQLGRGEETVKTAGQHLQNMEQRGEESVSKMQSYIEGLQEKAIAGDEASKIELRETFDNAYDKTMETGEKYLGDLREWGEEIYDKNMEQGEAARGRVSELVANAQSHLKSMTANTLQANYDGLVAQYDNSIAKAKARANLQGDPDARSEVARLNTERSRAVASVVSQAQIYDNNMRVGLDTLAVNMETTLSNQFNQTQASLGNQLISTSAGAVMNVLNQGATIQLAGAQAGAELDKALKIASVQRQTALETQGISAMQSLIAQEDMYASYAGQNLSQVALSVEQMNRMAESNAIQTNMAITELQRAGMGDYANYISNLPIAQVSMGQMLATLAMLVRESRDELETEIESPSPSNRPSMVNYG